MPNYSGKWTPSQILQARGQDLWPINGPFFYVDDVFSTYLYTGDSGTQSISNGIDLDGEGGLVWIKGRTAAYDNGLYDTARGATKEIYSNKTDAEQTNTDTVTSFNSNGFSIGADALVNTNLEDYVSWSFRKQAGFFDVVTYTGDGTSSRDIAHNLGSKPGFILTKRLNLSGNWTGYHQSLGYTKRIYLDLTNAASTNAATWVQEPTATHFTVGSENTSGSTYVAYLFASDDARFGDNANESIIKCGSYTGDGGAGTTEVDLGFEPQWILVKATSAADNWFIIDNMRGWATESNTSNDAYLIPNAANAESTGGFLDITATGFKTTLFTNVNVSGRTYAYVAIRRPMKTPTAATEVFAQDTRSSDSITTNFPVDAVIGKNNTATSDWFVMDRLRKTTPSSSVYLKTNSTAAETSVAAGIGIDSNTSIYNLNSWSAGIYYNFKRAPGFMDVVAYTGDGTSSRSLNHNLGVAPELMIIKQRSATRSWAVYSSATGTGKFLKLEDTAGVVTQSGIFDTAPTSSVFTVDSNTYVNASGGTYIAYLFATLDGISKVGSFTSSGTDINIDCGFTSGARFVLLKKTNAADDWFVWDTVRGITSGNDARLKLNSNGAEASADNIDPYSPGFTLTSGIIGSGNTFIYLAIA